MLRGMPGGLGQGLHISQAPRQCILRVAKVCWYLYMYTCRYIFSPVFCGFLSTALPWLHPLAAKTSYSLLPQDPRVFTIFPFPRSPGRSHFVSPTSSPFVFVFCFPLGKQILLTNPHWSLTLLLASCPTPWHLGPCIVQPGVGSYRCSRPGSCVIGGRRPSNQGTRWRHRCRNPGACRVF